MKRASILVAVTLLTLSACTPGRAPTPSPTAATLLPTDTPAPTATPSPTATFTAAPTRTATPTATSTATLAPTRLIPTAGQIWFAPMMYGQRAAPWQKGYGALDYLDLFREDAPWKKASSRVHVFKFYGGTLDALSNTELRQIVNYLNQKGIAIALEAPPLKWTAECGQGIEGFSNDPTQYTLRLAQRIQAAGGKLRFIAMDEPLTFGSANPPHGCGMSVEQVAQEVAEYITSIKRRFPDIIIGDIEYEGASEDKVKHFLESYHALTGEYLPFLHWDIDWRQPISWWNVDWKQRQFLWPQWPEQARELETFCRERGISFGMIYNGNLDASSDAEWIRQAEDHMAMYESLGGKPDHIIFQSWHMYPKHLLPETDPSAFTFLINRYFDVRTKLSLKVDSRSSSRVLVGKLTDISDVPIRGAQVEIRVKPLDGMGVVAEYTVTGTVPNNATGAIVGFRVNTECSCDGNSEFNLYEIRYYEGNENVQRVPNGNFSQGLGGWSYITSNTVRIRSSDLGSGQMLQVRAGPGKTATINSAKFPVTGNAMYTVTFVARVAPVSSVGSGYFAIFFLAGSTELERKMIPIEPAFLIYNAVTSENGDFRLDLSESPADRLIIQGKFEGDSTHWPAYARVTIP